MYHVEFVKKKKPKAAKKSPKSAEETDSLPEKTKNFNKKAIKEKLLLTGTELRKRKVLEDTEGTGCYSPEEFDKWWEEHSTQFFEAKSYMLLRACKEESVRKPILRDLNGKAIGRGSFWFREPFDYSEYERELPQGDYDRILSQDLTFTDRQQ